MSIEFVCPNCKHTQPLDAEFDDLMLVLGPELEPGVFSLKEGVHTVDAFEQAKASFLLLKSFNEDLERRANDYDAVSRRLAMYEDREEADHAHGPFVASTRRLHFHRPECEYAATFLNSPQCRVFENHEAAVAAGLRPCKTCRA